jgi:hypothetical protein
MKYLIYMSTSAYLFSDDELKQILRKSQANNAVNDLTGMLLYSEGSFVQVLEGQTEEVDCTYSKIQKDPRHKNIIKLTEGPLKQRIFPNFTMGFKVVSDLEFSRFDAYIDPTAQNWDIDGAYHPAITILKTFADNNF